MNYFRFLFINFIAILIFLKFAESANMLGNSKFAGFIVISLFVYFWVSQAIYIKWCLHQRELSSLSDDGLMNIHSAWVDTSGFGASSELGQLRKTNDNHKFNAGVKRLIQIKRECLKRDINKIRIVELEASILELEKTMR